MTRPRGARRRRGPRLVAAILPIAVLLAGCGGGSASQPAGSNGLLHAMAAVNAAGPARSYFGWADTTAVLKLAGQKTTPAFTQAPNADVRRWQAMLELGAGELEQDPAAVDQTIGLNYDDTTSATTIGIGSPIAVRVTGPGVDAGRITASLRRAGARSRRGLLSLSAHDSFNLPEDDGIDSSLLDAVSVRGDTIVAGTTAAAARAGVGAGAKSLASVAADRAAASCLGDVIWAEVFPAASVGLGGGGLVAIGVEASSSSPSASAVDRICAVGPQAAAQGARMRRTLVPSTTPLGDTRLGQVASSFAVDSGRAAGVRFSRGTLTMRNTANPDYVNSLYFQGRLTLLLATVCDPPVLVHITRLATGEQAQAACRRLGLRVETGLPVR